MKLFPNVDVDEEYFLELFRTNKLGFYFSALDDERLNCNNTECKQCPFEVEEEGYGNVCLSAQDKLDFSIFKKNYAEYLI